MDKTSEHMFGYFEPLYDVIHDMPRPPESFFKRKAGKPVCSQSSGRDPSQGQWPLLVRRPDSQTLALSLFPALPLTCCVALSKSLHLSALVVSSV